MNGPENGIFSEVKPAASGEHYRELPYRLAEGPPVRDLVARVLKEAGVGSDPRLRRAVAAWRDAVGSESFEQSRVTGLARGVLTVEVDSAALHQELAVYRKRELLTALRRLEPTISDVRFRVAGKRRGE